MTGMTASDTQARWREKFLKETGGETGAAPQEALYTARDVPPAGAEDEAPPGFFPFTRGVRASGYRGRPWTIRQYAGFSTAEASNQFYRDNLRKGQKGLSVAFDLPTHRGYDSDDPLAAGDVGAAGVAIDSVEDMKRLFEGIPLQENSISMTMSGAVVPIMAMFIVAAEEAGVKPHQLTGTIQNDILKEFMVRNTYIYPPRASLRLVGDVVAYSTAAMPKFNPISVSGYHMQEAGATPTQELAFTLANGLAYLETFRQKGLDLEEVAPRFSFFFAIGMDFFTEIAKLRAGRALWAHFMRERLGLRNPKAWLLRVHCQTSGVSLIAQSPYNNVIRTTLEALAAVLGGTQSLHTNALDEALGLPTPHSAELARATQQILQAETGLCDTIDPLGGSYYLEHLTDKMKTEAMKIIESLERNGGIVQSLLDGVPMQSIDRSAAERQALLDCGDTKIVGLNHGRDASSDLEPESGNEELRPADGARDGAPDLPLLTIEPGLVRDQQIQNLKNLRTRRDEALCQRRLEALYQGALQEETPLMALTLEAVRARATLGEISTQLERVFTRYQRTSLPVRGVYGGVLAQKGPTWGRMRQRIADFASRTGRHPRILIAKIGLDGHDRGAKMIASALADLGFDAELGPLFATPRQVARQALSSDVHVLGVSTQAAGHKILLPALMAELRAASASHIWVTCGGIIPEADRPFLTEHGVAAFFPPGTAVLDAAACLMDLLTGPQKDHRPSPGQNPDTPTSGRIPPSVDA